MAAALKEALRKTLDDLPQRSKKRFKHHLRDQGPIPWGALEEADTDEIVELMVQEYRQTAGDVMVTILEKMDRNQSAMDLQTQLRELGGQHHSSRGTEKVNMSGGGSRSKHKGGGDTPDRKVVLLGKTGSGKSAAANTILGERLFKAEMSFDPVTKDCKKKQKKVWGRTLTVIDTPGLSGHLSDRLRTQIQKYLVPGPHVFLLVIRLNEKITDDMKNAVKWIEENLGKDVYCYIIVLFTYADQLQGTELMDYCRASKFIRTLINSCGGRFHSFISDGGQDKVKEFNQVEELLEKIDKLVWWNSDQANYDSGCYDKAQLELDSGKYGK